ncbi:MAG: hypothetical protein R3300_05580 [Candidatus Promineifilaceae bacterium]|nr:hypothetical protein [Candidatus Promineifilaceae bacterium]
MRMATQLSKKTESDTADWLAIYVDALLAGSETASVTASTPEAVDRRQLALLARSLQAALIPRMPEPTFRTELSRWLSGPGPAAGPVIVARPPKASRWITMAVAGSMVSAVGLVWMWRRWRPAA